MTNLTKRFLQYVKIDTQSDPFSTTFPSSNKQKDLSNLLVKELITMSYNAFIDEYGYVYCKIEANTKGVTPIGLIAHVDTSFDAPGANVNPRIIKNYDGALIKLNEQYQMDVNTFPVLKQVIGDDIIVTDGNTLLGADDKCGVAIIMEFAQYCQDHPEYLHGDVYLCFTPDEEIGRGTDHFNYDWFKAKFAYTLDGSVVGGIEYENFNAASAKLEFIGKSIHPGAAKDKLINSQHLAFEFHSMLNPLQIPGNTQGYEGFNHLTNISGTVENTTSLYIIRDHDKLKFAQKKKDFQNIVDYLNQKYGYLCTTLTIKDSYFNMYEVLKDQMHIITLAQKAIKECGITPIIEPIRGGTDGARLTFEGLPCPNLGTGGFNFHGRFEFASINQMTKALEIVVKLVGLLVKND